MRCLKNLSAVVILYNPTNEVISNVLTYLDYVERLYVIDNSLGDNDDIVGVLLDNPKVIYEPKHENLGIAAPLNEVLRKEYGKSRFLLTMDQDSYFEVGMFERYLSVITLLDDKEVIGISPRLLANTRTDDINYEVAEKIMTSGNILKIKEALTIGGFDERFFIDEVDHEFSYRAARNGYKILLMTSGIYMEHSLGEVFHSVFGNVWQHNPIRVYYIIRNKMLIAKEYPEHRVRYILSIIKKIIKIIFLETEKMKKIRMVFRAVNDFVHNSFGRHE